MHIAHFASFFLSLFSEYSQVATIMSCPLPLPLPLLPPALHADYPPVHIGVKVCVHIPPCDGGPIKLTLRKISFRHLRFHIRKSAGLGRLELRPRRAKTRKTHCQSHNGRQPYGGRGGW